MEKRVLINDFATRCFRDIADHDYIAARLSYRHGLYSQFQWQALQALEKYFKAILLYNRIKAKDIGHDLRKALKYTERLPFEIKMTDVTDEMIEFLSDFGRFRYLEASYSLTGPKLAQLDRTVWDIRRYCRVLDYEITLSNGKVHNMLDDEIRRIESSDNYPPQKYKLIGGELEKIIKKREHPAREPLIWQNLFFGSTARKKVYMHVPFHAVNAPLFLHPEILDDVLNYIYLPADVVRAYREFSNQKKT